MKYEVFFNYFVLLIYCVIDQYGVVVDFNFEFDMIEEEVIKYYKDMLMVSIMDLIMFDVQC